MPNDKAAEVNTDQDLAEIGYAAYGATTDFKNFKGDPMPTWEELPGPIQSAWCAAADAIKKTVING